MQARAEGAAALEAAIKVCVFGIELFLCCLQVWCIIRSVGRLKVLLPRKTRTSTQTQQEQDEKVEQLESSLREKRAAAEVKFFMCFVSVCCFV